MIIILFVVVIILANISLYAFLACYLLRNRYVKGSRPRFILRSIRRPTQYVALLYMLITGVNNFRDHSWFWFCLDVLNVTWIAFSIREFNSEDEDDIWKRGKKKLKKVWSALKRRAREYKPSLVRPIPIPVGGTA